MRLLIKVFTLLALAAGCASALRLPEEGTGPRVQVYALWSQQYLCLGARVPDTMVTGSNVSPMSAPEQDDAIEFCLEAPGNRGPAAYRLAISAAGGMSVLKRDGAGNWRTDPSWISGPRTVKFAVVTDGTLNQPGDEDGGFVVECAIPWEFLTGGEAPSGERLGFNVVCWMQGESQGIASWSPLVTAEEEIGDSRRWGSLIVSFGSAPSSASGPVLECPFAGFTPFIDGRLAAEEWLTASTLFFYKPKPVLSPAAAGGPSRPGEPAAPSTLLAVYRYDWQGDWEGHVGAEQRRRTLWSESDLLAAPDQPKEGAGLWYSYERVAWHRQQLEEMTRAGIDILLARYRGDGPARTTWARAGLDRLTQAMKELRAAGKPYPLGGMMVDTGPLQGVDLKSEQGKRLLYGMIRDFFLHVPAEFRAQLGLLPERGGSGRVPVLLGDPQAIADWDAGFVSFCEERFREDFGSGIAWMGSGEWQKKGEMPFYAFVRLAGAETVTQEAVGGVSAMSLSPGYCRPGAKGAIRSRKEGRGYRTDWQRVLAVKPELIVINSWNDFASATEIAPSRQYGYAYLDTTRFFKAKLGSDQLHYLRLKQASVPRPMRAGATYLVEMLIENLGTQEVRTGGKVTADYRIIRRSDNTVVCEKIGAQALLLPAGFTRRVPVEITTRDGAGRPLPAGEYLFSLAVMKTKVSYLRSKWFARPLAELTVPITVGEPPARRASVISTSLPSVMESGATAPVVVRLRNDGGEKWPAGAVKLSYHWARCQDELAASSSEARETVVWEGARADLPRDVNPGEVVSVLVPVTARDAQGAPLPSGGPAELWHYRLQWDLVEGDQGWFSGAGAPMAGEEAIAVVEHHWGAAFRGTTTPAEMTAGQAVEVEVTVANAGPRRWKPGTPGASEHSALTHAWHYWDGQWCETAADEVPLPREVAPGETIKLTARVVAPPAEGMYWLCWELKHWCDGEAAAASGESDDLLVAPVLVKGGRYRPLDLSSLVNCVAVTTDSYRTRGDFDGAGRSFPAECLPPDLSGARTNVYPSSYYCGAAEQPVPFAFPEASSGVGGAVACQGQTIALGEPGARAAYLLAASVRGPRQIELALTGPEGGEEACLVTAPSWTQRDPRCRIGAFTPYLRGLSSDDAAVQGYLHVLEARPKELGRVSFLRLPRDPAVRILAVTVEGE